MTPRALTAFSLIITMADPPSLICDALAAVIVPSLSNAGLRPPSDSIVVLPRTPSSVDDHRRVALALRDAHRHDLVGEATVVDGGRGAHVALHRHVVLLLAGDVAGGVALGAEPHQAGVERAPQAVADDRVLQLGVAVAEATAGTLRQVRRVGHALHAAGDDDVGLAAHDHLVGEVDRC